MVSFEKLKLMNFGEVWKEYCKRENTPLDWYEKILQYEKDILSLR